MTGTTTSRRLTWQQTTVVGRIEETADATTIVLDLPEWPGHRAGQHVDVRLTAEDGYQAQRSYSIASAPEDESIALTVEYLPDGEVSPYLTKELREGDQFELRGPIGDYFVWKPELGGPLLLIAGGSGIAPLRAMLRHHSATASDVPVRLLYSSRSLPEVIYRDELRSMRGNSVDIRFTLTRQQPSGWRGYSGRIDEAMIDDVSWSPDTRPLVYICGPSGFVETAAAALVSLGHDPARIRTERFGPSGT